MAVNISQEIFGNTDLQREGVIAAAIEGVPVLVQRRGPHLLKGTVELRLGADDQIDETAETFTIVPPTGMNGQPLREEETYRFEDLDDGTVRVFLH